ncbi:SEL1-like repeat protein [Hellea balneolensis]|uniref:caspase family protein n=1 Tax=Hellea balneolensis TaxID=287478 RepID=UPI00041D0FF8|nr:caspase family protein [Hellea balneolensis]
MKKDNLNPRAATDSGDIRQNEVEVGDFHLLAVGINLYDHVGWNDLKSANNDVAALCALMELRYGFKEENIVLIPEAEATKGAIFSALRNFSPLRKSTRKLGPNDSLLIWLAGHGEKDVYEPEEEENDINGNLKRLSYFIPKNAPPEYCGETWINYTDFVSHLEPIRARHILVVSDSCFSAGIFERNKNNLGADDSTVEAAKGEMRFASRRALTSDADMRTVIDWGAYQNHSVFAYPALNFLTRNRQSHLSSSGFAWNIKKDMSSKHQSFQRPREGKLDIDGNKGGQFAFILESSIYEFSESEFKERKSHYLNIVATPVVERQIKETEKPKVALNKKPKKDANAEFKKILRSPSVDLLQEFIFEFPTNENSPEAYYQIGLLSCANKKFVEGHNAFLKAATRSHSRAMMAIGHQYKDGHGVIENPEAAWEWYSKAAEHGDLDAKHLLELAEKKRSEEAKDQLKSEFEETPITKAQETNEHSSENHLLEGNDKKVSDETEAAEFTNDKQVAKVSKRSKKNLAYIFSAIVLTGILTTPLVRDNIQKREFQTAKQQAISLNTIAGFESLEEFFPEHAEYVKTEILRLNSEETDRKDKEAYESAASENTLASYKHYLGNNPDGSFRSEVEVKILELTETANRAKAQAQIEKDNADWLKAQNANTVRSMDKYLANHPSGQFVSEAKAKRVILLDDEDFDRIKNIENMASLSAHVDRFSYCTHFGSLDDRAFALAVQRDTSFSYKEYERYFKSGRYLGKSKLASSMALERELFESAVRSLERKTSKVDLTVVKSYIKEYRNGKYRGELESKTHDAVQVGLEKGYEQNVAAAFEYANWFYDFEYIDEINLKYVSLYGIDNFWNSFGEQKIESIVLAARNGDPKAQNKLGTSVNSNRVPASLNVEGSAYDWWIKAANQNDSDAQVNIGNYLLGNAKNRNDELIAAEWYVKAYQSIVMDSRRSSANYYAGLRAAKIYIKDSSTISKGTAILDKIALLNDNRGKTARVILSQLILNNMYRNGDYDQAANWLEEALLIRDVEYDNSNVDILDNIARYSLAKIYLIGLGGQKNVQIGNVRLAEIKKIDGTGKELSAELSGTATRLLKVTIGETRY